MFTAKIIEHSKSVAGREIISLQLSYPKFIHSEFMTHRVFSRNASSSRAIPFDKFIKDVENDTAMPIFWGKNQPGMQAREEIEAKDRIEARMEWVQARNDAMRHATNLHKIGVHKQIVNRLLEPFYNINVLVTATDWDNFFELRAHEDAQPEMRELALVMQDAIKVSTPNLLERGEWHLPYIKKPEKDQHNLDSLIKMSVARCARVSYKTHEDKLPEAIKDLLLYERLVVAEPLHASPAEHQATPDPYHLLPLFYGNFNGWIQYRKLLEKKINPMGIWEKLYGKSEILEKSNKNSS